MRITFVRPNMITGRSHDAMEPLALAILAGLTPPHVDVVMYDERLEPVPMDEPTDLVAMSVDTFSSRRAYEMAAEYHRRGIPVVMGGAHPTLCTEEALSYADTLVVGDAEDTWPELVGDAERGELKRLYHSRFPPLANTPINRGVFGRRDYGPIHITQFGRGCPHNCDFCSSRVFSGDRIRHRMPDDVVRDIQNTGGSFFLLADDNLFADRSAGEALCMAIKPLKVRWACQISIDLACDADLVEAMADSGCIMILVGFETVSRENLLQMRKGWNDQHASYDEVAHIINSNGIMLYGTFVLGYDADTPDTVQACVDLAVRLKFALANFNLLIPFPGTSLYERLKKEQRLLYDPWWLHPDYRFGKAVFRPKSMTVEQLEQGCLSARREFNSIGNISRRALDWRANMRNSRIYWVTNLASRHELQRKQGARLGMEDSVKPLFQNEAHAG